MGISKLILRAQTDLVAIDFDRSAAVIADFNQERRGAVRTENTLRKQFQPVEYGPAVSVRSRTDDFVLPNEGVSGILRLENVRRIHLHCLALIRSKLILLAVGNVGNVWTAEQKAGVPPVKDNNATILSGTTGSRVCSDYEAA